MGRIIRAKGERVRAIVEEKVATATQKKVNEVSSGILCFSRRHLLENLGKLTRDNAQGEYLLTDLIEIFNRKHLTVLAFKAPEGEAAGINDRTQLAEVGKEIYLRRAIHWMKEGVTLTDPWATYIDEDVAIGPRHGDRGRRLSGWKHKGWQRMPNRRSLHD